jgi:hypothetical protein
MSPHPFGRGSASTSAITHLWRTRHRRTSAARSRILPGYEHLEDRALLSTYTVLNSGDSGPGSLRQAILSANQDTTPDTIAFQIPTSDPGYNPATGAWAITLASGLPVITNAVTIDGTTQPGFHPTSVAIPRGTNDPGPGWTLIQPVVEINGQNLPSINLLDIQASNCTVEGLVLDGLGTGSVAISAEATAANTLIQGNFLGTNVSGTAADGAGRYGVLPGGQNCTVGGAGQGQGNLISGFTEAGINPDSNTNTHIEGNFIGTNATGTAAIPNNYGIETSPAPGGVDNLIVGGTTSGAGNLISGNGVGSYGFGGPAGIFFSNLIGTDLTGTKAIPNGEGLSRADIVGGCDPGDRNIISGNTLSGVTVANVIQGNYVGTDISGEKPLGNRIGVFGVHDGFLIGGPTAAARNVISGNSSGIDEIGPGATIENNYIGTDATGEFAIANSYGISSVTGSTIANNLISGNGAGIIFDSGNTIQGNRIGTNAEGTKAVPNSNGILLPGTAGNSLIGGTSPGQGNLISGNTYAGIMSGDPSNAIVGNFIGTNFSGTAPLTDANGNPIPGNEWGVQLAGATSGALVGGTTQGSGNVIAYNDAGVLVEPSFYHGFFQSVGVSILGNSIHDNLGAGISLYPGANHQQAAPVLTTFPGNLTALIGTLSSTPNSRFRIEFYANPQPSTSPYVQGQYYLGSIDAITDASGVARFEAGPANLAAWSATDRISATATLVSTNPDGTPLYLDTSSFSQDETTPTLNVSAKQSSPGAPVTFTATLPPDSSASAPGSVTFTDTTTGTNLGTVPLSRATACLTTTVLGAGPHVITATYAYPPDPTLNANLGSVSVMVSTPHTPTPTTYTVNLTSDTGATGDVRWAINQANSNTNLDGSVIVFDPTVTSITVAHTLVLSEAAGPEEIQGPVTISGGGNVGVFQVQSGTTATLSDLTVSGGLAVNGGGIDNSGSLTIANCTVDSNASTNNGGDIINRGTLTVTRSTISNGVTGGPDANGVGAGAGINSTGILTIADSAILGNYAGGNGAGICVTSGSLSLTNSTLANNQTQDNGGGSSGSGIYNVGMLETVNTTIAYNQVGGGDSGGAGIYDAPGSTARLFNSIVALNTDAFGLPNDIEGTSVSASSANNLIGGDPGLDPNGPQDNGGPTQTIALLPSSLAIGAGSNALAVDPSTGQPLTYDQRGPGYLRVLGNYVDLGAYEYPATLSSAKLQTVIATVPAGGSVTVSASSDTDVSAAVQAVTGLTPPPSPVTITLDLGAGTYSGETVSPPAGVTLVIDCSNGPVTFVGHSPAFTVLSGQVSILGATFTNTTNAPTIVVNGGSLALRNCTIQESTGYSQAAILITGGSVDLGATSSPGGNTLNINGTGMLIENLTDGVVPAVGDTFENNGATPVSNFGVVGLSTPSRQTANQGVPKLFGLGSLTDTLADAQTWNVDVNWGDGSADTMFNATSNGALSAQSHAFALPGSYTVTVTATDPLTSQVTAWDLVQSFTVTIAPSLFVLNPTTSGALAATGNASVEIPGAIVVDSNAGNAISASGNAQLQAAVIDVAGGYQKSGNAALSPAPTKGVSVPDPLMGLSSPNVTGLTIFGSVSLSGNAQKTIGPGIYSQISVSGNARLTLGGGTYIIEGGGLTVTGNASISGSGVMIYNAGSNFPNSGGNFGGITLSGTGTINLSAPMTGTNPGVLIFQSRQNTRALSISGNALAGMTGTIYAPSALLSLSGNAQLQSPLIVGALNLSGNVALTQMAAGSDGTGDTSGVADTLLAGNLSVYINDPGGYLSADELARIQDAINGWDALLAPYNVTISEVSDPSLANVVLDTGTTSACGGIAEGVLGCYNSGTNEITLVRGWNWYAGADPTQIGPGQYDFETTVAHELGHALGLGGSTDPTSPMHETLASGTTHRTMTVADLNIPYPPEGADPLSAAGPQPGPANVSMSVPGSTIAATAGITLPGIVNVVPIANPVVISPPIFPGLSSAISVAPAAPSGRLAVVPSGTRADLGRLVPNLSDPARGSVRASALGTPFEQDQEPAQDLITSSGRLPSGKHQARSEADAFDERAFLETWDEAIKAYEDEGETPTRPAVEVEQPPSVMAEPSGSPIESTFMAGVAVALWASWEIRSRASDSRRQRPSWRRRGL